MDIVRNKYILFLVFSTSLQVMAVHASNGSSDTGPGKKDDGSKVKQILTTSMKSTVKLATIPGAYFFVEGKFLSPYGPGEIKTVQDWNNADNTNWDKKNFVSKNYAPKWNTIGDIGWGTCMAAGIISILPRHPKYGTGKQFWILLQAGLSTNFVTEVTKRIARRPRPFLYSDDFRSLNPDIGTTNYSTLLMYKDRKDGNKIVDANDSEDAETARMSFFSGHTATSAAVMFVAAKMLTQAHFVLRYEKILVWTTATSLPLFIGYTRMKAGKHYTGDVLAGYGVGALIGYFVVPWVNQFDETKLSFNISPGAVQLSYSF